MASITQTTNKDAVQFTFENVKEKVGSKDVQQDVSLIISTVKEAGTLVVQKSSQDGTGGIVSWNQVGSNGSITKDSVKVANYNQAPKVSVSSSTQEMVAILGATTVSLSSINIVDDSTDLLVTLSPSRGVYSGSFAYLESTLISKFIANKSLVLTYMVGSTVTPLPDKIPAGVGKIFIEAHQSIITTGQNESVTYKASDLVNLVLSSINFQINRSLFSRDDVAKVQFDLAINDSYSMTKDVGSFAAGGDRLIVGSVSHNTIGDENADGKIDSNDTVVKVSTLRQLITDADTTTLDAGLHRTDSSKEDGSPGIQNDLSNAKLFTVTNKSIIHQFDSALADMIVDKALGSTNAIYLHADETLSYDLINYAKAGFAGIYNESATGELFGLTVSEANTLSKLNVQVIGDTSINFESDAAETLKIPFTSLSLLTQWNSINDETTSDVNWEEPAGVVDYLITGMGTGDKIDLSSFPFKTSDLNYITESEAGNLVSGLSATTLSGTKWFAVNDAINKQVHIFGGDVSASTSDVAANGRITLKVDFEIDLTGMTSSYLDKDNKYNFLIQA